MNMNTTTFNARELCSRKLWQMVNTPADREVGETELQQAIDELAVRRHYLEELQEIGRLRDSKTGA